MSASDPVIPTRAQLSSTFQASKWQQLPVLLSFSEMKSLIEAIGDFYMIRISGLIDAGQEIVPKNAFLAAYQDYVDAIIAGNEPKKESIQIMFSLIWTKSLETVYRVPVKDNKGLVRVESPVVQLQAHRFDYSTADEKFRSMVLGSQAITWGIQFSFPHLFQDAGFNVHKVTDENIFPNVALFKSIRQWVREKTTSTKIEVNGKVTAVPIRLGKECTWINQHPRLIEKRLRVVF